MPLPGTLLPRANAAACPQLAKADFASSSQHLRDGQRIAALDDYVVAGAASGAAGEHGNVRTRRKETCGALNEGRFLPRAVFGSVHATYRLSDRSVVSFLYCNE
jgi:hypothetical protein